MREIIFRGKRLDNGEWETGSLMKVTVAERTYFLIFGDGFAYDAESIKALAHGCVDPDTVGQYAGLRDKCGNRIFEGDIVKREFTLWHGETKKTRETQFGVVVYSNKECGFRVEKKCNLRKPWNGDTIEVIGNIHDNPEIMKGE